MNEEALSLVKARLGISSTVRDVYLTSIIDSVTQEMTDIHGIALDNSSGIHLMFVVDYAEYRYSNRENKTMPRHLQFRLHNLVIKSGGVPIV